MLEGVSLPPPVIVTPSCNLFRPTPYKITHLSHTALQPELSTRYVACCDTSAVFLVTQLLDRLSLCTHYYNKPDGLCFNQQRFLEVATNLRFY